MRVILIIALLLLSGCSTLTDHIIVKPPHPEVPPMPQLAISVLKPNSGHDEIAKAYAASFKALWLDDLSLREILKGYQ